MSWIKKARLLLLISVVFLPVFLFAQTDVDLGPDGDDVNDANVPFDGGVGVLVAAGVAYGLKKYRDNKKAEKDNL